MADNSFGLSFSPLLSNMPQQGQYSGQGGGPLQEAIQMLSLRRPTVYGAQAPASAQLLNSPGGSGIPGLDQLLQALGHAANGGNRTLPPAEPLGPMQRPPIGQAPVMGAGQPLNPSITFPMPRPPFEGGTAGYPPAAGQGIPQQTPIGLRRG